MRTASISQILEWPMNHAVIDWILGRVPTRTGVKRKAAVGKSRAGVWLLGGGRVERWLGGGDGGGRQRPHGYSLSYSLLSGKS
jgi:hypothetical protein